MYRVKNLSTLLLLITFLLCMPRFAAAQQRSNTDACNQPLPDPNTHFAIPEAPASVVASADGCWIFVGTSRLNQNGYVGEPGVVVIQRNAGMLKRTRFLPLLNNGMALALTHDGKLLIVSGGPQTVFVDVEKLITGAPDREVILGALKDEHFGAANSVAITADDAYLFVGQWRLAWISVIDLKKARAHGFQPAAIIGGIPLDGDGINGLAVSPDNRRLYAVTVSAGGVSPSIACKGKGRTLNSGPSHEGAFVVVDISRAVLAPASSIVASVPAGCFPGRMNVSPDGNTVYTTATEDDNVLAFDVRPISKGSPPVLIEKVQAGPAPVGVMAIDGGKKIVVANSNLFEYDGIAARSTHKDTLSVIDADRIPTGYPSALGSIPAGTDPINISITADRRTLLVGNLNSLTLQLIDLDRLPVKPHATAENDACNQPLPDPNTHFAIPEAPWHAVASADGCWIFVATAKLNQNEYVGENGIVVIHRNSGVLRRMRFLPLQSVVQGLELTHDGKVLVVANWTQVLFIDVAKLISGAPDPDVKLGALKDGHFAGTNHVVITADDALLFVKQWSVGWISVIDLTTAREEGFKPSAIIGGIPTGENPNGWGLSPDGRFLYVSADFSQPGSQSVACKGDKGLSFRLGPHPVGALLVIDVSRAKSDPESSLIAEVPAGCTPAGFAVSPDGTRVYFNAKEDDTLLAFDVRPVRSGSPPVLIGKVPLGPAPVGVMAIDGGEKIVVANSNSYEYDGIATRSTHKDTLSVIDAEKISTGSPSVLGSIPAGTDPRNVSITADGRTLLVGNLNSLTLELIDLDRLQAVKPRVTEENASRN
jgi:DNA-binding beta-propeller fold protein YncE